MPQTHQQRLKSILYRCQHRGCKELDMLLGNFAKGHLQNLTLEQLSQFEKLLACPESDLLAWLMGMASSPEGTQGEMVRMIRDFVDEV